MKYPFLFSLASLESPSWSGSAETVVKILHIYPVPKVLEIWQSAALEYEKANSTVKIEFDYLENEEFKAKLPTLLQSNDRPSLFHSWGGGVMREQIQAKVCQDITNAIDGDFKDSFYPAGVHAFTADGKSYGLPDSVGPIVFWYNKELCEKADVDPSAIKYWEDLLDAVQRCKAAGVIPIAAGGSVKWPLQFFPALLMMRVLGKDGMASAYQGDNGGFAGPDVVKAWKLYKELCDLDSFQEGFQTMNTRDAAAFFHDGKAAFYLMGTWVLTASRLYAADKKGLPEAKLGWFFFPEVQGGKGKVNDIFGSVYGWLVSKDAPKETIDFMKVWLGKETQTKLAAEGLSIPMVKGTSDSIQNPFFKALALEVDHSDWICVAMDQLLGREFLAWSEQHLDDIRLITPMHVAAYIEQHPGSPQTIKQHLAAIKMLFDYLVISQIVPVNPAAPVKGPTHVVKRGKTPVLSVEDARSLLASISTDSLQGLRDRALIGVMLFSFARVSAVLGMKVSDFYENGRRRWFRLLEKGGKHHEVPVHHKAQDYVAEYLEKAGFEPNKPLFQTFHKKQPTGRPMSRSEAYRMIRRRALAAGIFAPVCCHSFRATGITVYLENNGTLETAQKIAAHESPRTTKLYDRTDDQLTLDEIEKISV